MKFIIFSQNSASADPFDMVVIEDDAADPGAYLARYCNLPRQKSALLKDWAAAAKSGDVLRLKIAHGHNVHVVFVGSMANVVVSTIRVLREPEYQLASVAYSPRKRGDKKKGKRSGRIEHE